MNTSLIVFLYDMHVHCNSNKSNFYFVGKHYLHQSRFHLGYYIFINPASTQNVFFHLSSFCCGHKIASSMQLLLTVHYTIASS